jgi:hypothetical protein
MTDPFIFLGIAGATGQVTTSQAWILFGGVLVYRAINTLIARFLYQCFMNNLSLEPKVNESYHEMVKESKGRKHFREIFNLTSETKHHHQQKHENNNHAHHQNDPKPVVESDPPHISILTSLSNGM